MLQTKLEIRKWNLLAKKQKSTASEIWRDCGEKYFFQDSFMHHVLHTCRYQSCDILLSTLRNPGDHAGDQGDQDDQGHGGQVVTVMCQEYRGVPCNCEVACKPVEEMVGERDSKKMKMTGEMMIRALSAVRTAVHHDMISEEDYVKKYSDFVRKKEDNIADADEATKNDTEDDDDDGICELYMRLGGCVLAVIAFIVGMIVLLTLPEPSWRTN